MICCAAHEIKGKQFKCIIIIYLATVDCIIIVIATQCDIMPLYNISSWWILKNSVEYPKRC